MMKRVGLLILPLAAAACGTPRPNLPSGSAAYQMFPVASPGESARSYVIGPLDQIALTVFQEPDLSARDIQVDASGNVLLPLIGTVRAAGRTTAELSKEVAARLSTQYLVNPQVSVLVQQSVSQKVTVEGSVTEPGVYSIQGKTTLIDAIALAKGTSRIAKLNDVAVFREINGQQMGALFNVAEIRRGKQPNPEILGNDTVVVGLSGIKSAWRDILTAAPLVTAFRPF